MTQPALPRHGEFQHPARPLSFADDNSCTASLYSPPPPIDSISRGPSNLHWCVNCSSALPRSANWSPQPRADPSFAAEPTMNSSRFIRPFARAFRQPTLARPSTMARPALAASQGKLQKPVQAQQMVH